jgi:hypothetical protein
MYKMTETALDGYPYDTDWWSLDNGFSLRGVMPGWIYDNIPDMNWTNSLLNLTAKRGLKNDSIAFKDSGSIILSTFANGNAPGTSPSQPDWYAEDKPKHTGPGFADPIAFECVLHLCILTMHAESIDGTLTETTEGT